MKRLCVLFVIILCGMVQAAHVLIANGTSQTIQFVMYDTSNAPKTGLVYTDFTVTYTIDGAAAADVTEATLASASAAFSSGGIILIDDTKCPGLYRFDVPNAACIVTAGAKRVSFTFKATGCNNTYAYYDLTPSVNVVLVNGNAPVATPTNFASMSINGSGEVVTSSAANTSIAEAVVGLTGIPVPPGSGGAEVTSGALTARTVVGNQVTDVTLAVGSSADDDYYNGKQITFNFDSTTLPKTTVTITDYTGSSRVAVISPYPLSSLVGVNARYTILNTVPVGTSVGSFGINAQYAVLEKAGNVAGSTLSTTTTIYLTANTYPSLYIRGMKIMFADSSGLYHEGIIESNSAGTLTFQSELAAEPADNTPIYSMGYSYVTVPLNSSDLDRTLSSGQPTLAGYLFAAACGTPWLIASTSSGYIVSGSAGSNSVNSTIITTGGPLTSIRPGMGLFYNDSALFGGTWYMAKVKSYNSTTRKITFDKTMAAAPANDQNMFLCNLPVSIDMQDLASAPN